MEHLEVALVAKTKPVVAHKNQGRGYIHEARHSDHTCARTRKVKSPLGSHHEAYSKHRLGQVEPQPALSL